MVYVVPAIQLAEQTIGHATNPSMIFVYPHIQFGMCDGIGEGGSS